MDTVARIIKDWDLKKILKKKPTILALMLLLFFIVDVYPKLYRIGILHDQIRTARRAAVVLTPQEKEKQKAQLEQELRQTGEQINLLEQELQKVQTKLSQIKNDAVVALEVEDLAAAAKIKLTSIKPLANISREHYAILPIEIKFRAEYAQLIDFLTKIEDAASVMSVQGLSIRKDQPVDPQADIELKLYVLSSPVKESGGVNNLQGSMK